MWVIVLVEFIAAKKWRTMKTSNILSSLDSALAVLGTRDLDKSDIELLLSFAETIVRIVREKV